MLKELVLKTRSYRRFVGDFEVELETLKELIDLARLTASAANRQPLKYVLVNEGEKNDLMFNNLAWAGYLKDWSGPVEGERPSAYIIILGDTEITSNYLIDPGIAAQTILLGATEKDLGGCIFASINRQNVREAFTIPEQYEILYVIALGKPLEKVELESVGEDGDIKYWRDEDQTHHVPKRKLEDIILE